MGDGFEFSGGDPKYGFDIVRGLLPDFGKTGLRIYEIREATHRSIEDHSLEAFRGNTGFRILRDVAESHADVDDLPRAKSSRTGVSLFDEAVLSQLAKVK